MREILFFWVSYQSTYAEDANGGVCWLRGCEGGGLWWDFPLHDTAAFSACVNEASLTCLIILCKLQDQGTYRKPSAMQCVSVCVYLYLSQGHIFRNLSFCIQNEINLDIFWWRPGLKEHLLSKFCISECYISIEPHKNRVFLISLSQSDAKWVPAFAGPDFCSFGWFHFAYFINKTCTGAVRWHSSHSYQHNAMPRIPQVCCSLHREKKDLIL